MPKTFTKYAHHMKKKNESNETLHSYFFQTRFHYTEANHSNIILSDTEQIYIYTN